MWLILAYAASKVLHLLYYNPASARLTIGLLMFNALIQLKIIQYWWCFWRQWCSDVASGIDRHPDRTEIISDCRYSVIESSSLVPVLFREVFSHPYISFFHLLVNGFSVIYIRTDPITLPCSLARVGNNGVSSLVGAISSLFLFLPPIFFSTFPSPLPLLYSPPFFLFISPPTHPYSYPTFFFYFFSFLLT